MRRDPKSALNQHFMTSVSLICVSHTLNIFRSFEGGRGEGMGAMGNWKELMGAKV